VRLKVLLLTVVLAVAAPAAAAIHAGAWKGEASAPDGTVIGPWTFKVEGRKITKLKVTIASGCGAKLTVQPEKPITIKAKAFTTSVKAPDGLKITLKGTINARSARGVFTTGPKCKVEGRLRARAST
jgi:hypothetical protein